MVNISLHQYGHLQASPRCWPPWCVATVAPPSPGALAQLATVPACYGATERRPHAMNLGSSGAGIFILWLCQNSYWKSPFLMGKSTINGHWGWIGILFLWCFSVETSWLGLWKKEVRRDSEKNDDSFVDMIAAGEVFQNKWKLWAPHNKNQHVHLENMRVSINWGTPNWMVQWFIMEHPIKMDDLEVLPF